MLFEKRIKFRYNPHAYKNGSIITVPGVCDCCGRKTKHRVFSIYTPDKEQRCICPKCVADGSAAERFSAIFVSDAEGGIDDITKTDELFRRTPGYFSRLGDIG